MFDKKNLRCVMRDLKWPDPAKMQINWNTWTSAAQSHLTAHMRISVFCITVLRSYLLFGAGYAFKLVDELSFLFF